MVAVTEEPLRKRLAASGLDLLEKIVYPQRLLPPFSMRRFVGEARWELSGQNFRREGERFQEQLVQNAGLRPESWILDMGSGCGRLALPLTALVKPPGHYWGLEIARVLVRWCQRELTQRFPHFEFVHCDVYHPSYNPGGKLAPETYRFPFENNAFDVVVATSVFTHLLAAATENYLRECARVLKPGGRFFGTFFLMENRPQSAHGGLDFRHPQPGGGFSIDPQLPERAVA